jgi:hypothetical protein
MFTVWVTALSRIADAGGADVTWMRML